MIYSVKVFSTRSIADHAGICKGFFGNILSFPNRVSFISADCRADLQQNLSGNAVGCVAQVMQNGRRGKLPNPVKVLILNIIAGVKATAGKKGVLDTGSQKIAVTHFKIEIVQSLQKTSLGVVGKIAQMLSVNLLHSRGRNLHEALHRVTVLGGTVAALQRGENRAMMLLPERPKVGNLSAPDGPGVRHIENIFQMGPAAVLANQGNPLGAGTDPPVHSSIPKLHAGAGRRVGPLRIDQELIVKGILVKAGGRVQVVFPRMAAPRHVLSGLTGQLRNTLKFAWHGCLNLRNCESVLAF